MNKDAINQLINADIDGECRYDMHIWYSSKEKDHPICIKCGQKFTLTKVQRKKRRSKYE